MKTINVGTQNDAIQYAINVDGDLLPLSTNDLKYEAADYCIMYDSGLYPGIALEELPRYICRKAQAVIGAAAALGSIRTERKAQSSRENGRLGGRPAKDYSDYIHEFENEYGQTRYAVCIWDENAGQYYAPLTAEARRLTGCYAEFSRTLKGMGGFKTRAAARRRADKIFNIPTR